MKKIVLIIIFLFFLFPTSVFAQTPNANEILRVSPVIIPLSLEAGKVITQDVSVENLLDSPLAFKASLSDFDTQDENGGFIFKDTVTNPLLSWTTLSEKDFLLAAHEKKTVTLTIAVPQTLPVGGYFGMLFFEPLLPQKSAQETQVATRVGILLLANIGVTDKKNADIVEFSLGGIFHEDSLPILLRVKNNTLQFFTAKPILSVTPFFGGNEKRVTLEDRVIFPGKIRRWEQTNQLTQMWGIYKIKLLLSAGGGNITQDEKTIIVFPVQKTLIGLALLLLIIILIRFNKRIIRAIKILINNS